MIYTLGHTESYERYFKEQEKPQKKSGGSVWITKEEAERYLVDNSYSVYGVIADWELETTPNKDGGDWNDLLVNADLINLNSNLQMFLYLTKFLFHKLGSLQAVITVLQSKDMGYPTTPLNAINNGNVEYVLIDMISRFNDRNPSYT